MEPLNHLHIYAAARLAHGDLFEIDRQLAGGHDLNGQWVLLVKQTFIAVASLTDLELTVRRIYKEQPKVYAEYKKWQRQFDFAKYVRNILVGHTNPALIEKAIEWKPELYSLLGETDENARLLINVFLLETAINTYVMKTKSTWCSTGIPISFIRLTGVDSWDFLEMWFGEG